MIWLRSILGARWFPYALIGIPLLVVAIYGKGRWDGYQAGETAVQTRIDAALKKQREDMLEIQAKDLANVVRTEIRKTEVDRRVDEIQRPTGPSVDLGADWMRAYTDGVRAANAGAGTVDF